MTIGILLLYNSLRPSSDPIDDDISKNENIDNTSSDSPVSFRGAESFQDYAELPDLIRYSDIIIEGTVGIVLDQFHHEILHNENVPPWFTDMQLDDLVYGSRELFHQIDIVQVLKGSPGTSIVLVRGDPKSTHNMNLSELIVKQRILLFATRVPTEDLPIDSFETVYVSRDDYAIFDIDSDRAYPRDYYYLYDVYTVEDGFYSGADVPWPYFEYGKLKFLIEQELKQAYNILTTNTATVAFTDLNHKLEIELLN